jgi:4-oxalocrotonate tautomerase
MPHIIIKLYPGRSNEVKKKMTHAIIRDVVETAGCEESAVSVAIEEIDPADWPEKVYRPDILARGHLLYKKPGYNPFK